MRPNMVNVQLEGAPKVLLCLLIASKSAQGAATEVNSLYGLPFLKIVFEKEEVGQGSRKIVYLRLFT